MISRGEAVRIVTDQLGNVVYSVAHDPYGGIQKEGVTTYDPMPKFSGKERDEESQLDYFGARYYDREQYRFISVDPVINSILFNPQLTNLYSYSRNNPISFLDFNGAYPVYINIVRTGIGSEGGIMGTFSIQSPYDMASGYTLECPYRGEKAAKTKGSEAAIMAGIYSGILGDHISERTGLAFEAIELFNKSLLGTRTRILIHNGKYVGDTKGCILVGFGHDPVTGILSDPAGERINDLVKFADTGMPETMYMMMEGFATLISINDFPEITVEISWDPNFLSGYANIARSALSLAF